MRRGVRDVGGGRQLKTSRASACGTGVHAAGYGRRPGGVRERRVDGRVRRRVRDVGGDRGRRRQIMGSAVYALCSAATRPECVGAPTRLSSVSQRSNCRMIKNQFWNKGLIPINIFQTYCGIGIHLRAAARGVGCVGVACVRGTGNSGHPGARVERCGRRPAVQDIPGRV